MKKILIFFLMCLYPIVGFSAIDERKTDIYFANGIKTSDAEARKNAFDILKPAIERETFIDESEMKKKIGKVDYAYNSTHDIFEEGDGWFDLIEPYF